MKNLFLTTLFIFVAALALVSSSAAAQSGAGDIPALEITNLTAAATETTNIEPPKTEPLPALSSIPTDKTEGKIEKRASVIKVDNGQIYTDAGALEGVSVGDFMIVCKMEPLTDLKGNVLDEDEVSVGKIVIEEVRNRVSLGRRIAGNESILRGYFVKYWVHEKNKEHDAAALGAKCPPGMLYDDGGVFEYKPGNVSKTVTVPAVPEVAESGPFCIDKNPGEGFLSWAEAKQFCSVLGKRMCEITEMRKVCATWEKPIPCSPEMEKTGECPEQNTIMDFRTALEWTTDLITKDGMPHQDAYSCSCPGPNPVCVHCFYDQCRGAEKRYRCCSEPY